MGSNIEALETAGRQILKKLNEFHFEAYFVGGYVRDKVLGRPIADIDIATSALPEQVMQLFERTVPTGLKHGTITVLIDSYAFEVTTFRRESEYENHRRPRAVEYITELREDLSRRDFTMNAMALDIEGRLIDPFGGQDDLNHSILRSVGDPKERFKEDALRMLRCIRLAAEYELQIDQKSWQALLLSRNLMQSIAMERVRSELERILLGSYPDRGFHLLKESGILLSVKIELSMWPLANPESQNWNWSKLSSFTADDNQYVRWTTLLWLTNVKLENVKLLLRILTCSNKLISEVYQRFCLLEQISSMSGSEDEKDEWKKSVVHFNSQTAKDAIRILELLDPARYQILHSQLIRWCKEIPIWSIRELEVSGNDIKQFLIEHGEVNIGPQIGQLLQQLLYAVVFGKVANEREKLLGFAKQCLASL